MSLRSIAVTLPLVDDRKALVSQASLLLTQIRRAPVVDLGCSMDLLDGKTPPLAVQGCFFGQKRSYRVSPQEHYQ